MSTTFMPTPTSVLRIGHAHGDMTPPVGIYHRMWGAARHDRATGVHRPLQADVLVLEPVGRPEERILRVQLDLVLLTDEQTDEVVADLVRAAGVDRDRVLVTFSHSHAAGFFLPDRIPLPGGEHIEPYLAGLKGTLGSLAREALENLEESVVSYAAGRCSMAANRDYHDEERGLRVTGFNPGEAAEDLVLAARVTAADGTPRLHLVHYACHPTTLSWDNSLLSPDFVGAARQVVSDHTGTPCVYLQGPCGELGPRDGFSGDTEVADRNGRQLGFAALSALAGLGPPGHDFAYQGPVLSGATIGTWAWMPMDGPRAEAVRRWSGGPFQVDLPLKPLPDAGELRADLDRHARDQARADAAGDDLAARDAGARAERCRRWLRRLAELPPGDRCPYRFTVHEIGDAIWITCAAEPYSLLAGELRRRFPDRTVLVIPMAGDPQLAYLLPRDRYGLGLYQEEPSCLAPGCLEAVLEAMTEAVEELTGARAVRQGG